MSFSSLHRSIVTVYISPEKYPFYVHKGHLCQVSSFFERGFHGSWEEASTESMYLEEDGIEEFKVFEEWLYTRTLNYPRDSENSSLLGEDILLRREDYDSGPSERCSRRYP